MSGNIHDLAITGHMLVGGATVFGTVLVDDGMITSVAPGRHAGHGTGATDAPGETTAPPRTRRSLCTTTRR